MPASCSRATMVRNRRGPRPDVLRVARLRREEAERVVAPVVRQPLFDQHAVVDEAVDRQQLDGGDAEALQMLDRCRLRQAAVGAAQVLRARPGAAASGP